MIQIEYVVIHQGKPIINDVWLVDKTNSIALVMIDMHSKYCAGNTFTGIDDSPAIIINAPEHALHLDKNAQYDDTMILFPSLAGYDVICASGGRYDIHVGFINFKNIEHEDTNANGYCLPMRDNNDDNYETHNTH